jgi:tetratricopeptide (TPR) repeat protein
MFRRNTMIAALAAAGMIGGTLHATTKPAARAPLDPLTATSSACATGAQKGATLKHYLKVAAAANELKPYGDLAPLDPQSEMAHAPAPSHTPLYAEMGTLTYPVSTAHPKAQRYFDQGLKLAYAFNHAEAARAFRAAQQLDPGCAMCYWGEALVLGPNINAPMQPEDNGHALSAIRQAQANAHRASPKESALIDALSARYSDAPDAQRAALDAAYAEKMQAVARRFPLDSEISLLTAEALMDLQPWDYWEGGGARPKGNAATMIALVEGVLARNPEHPGAIHFYIHLVEASNDPRRAEPYADRLGALIPAAGHLVHMPSHIYYRVGRYTDSLEANRRAVQADERYFQQATPSGIYSQGYYPHNMHFLMVSAQMAGDGSTAVEAAEKLAGIVSDEAAKAIAFVQPIKAAPYFAHAQFSSPRTVLALPAPSDGLPYVKGMWHYARAVAHATQGDLERAESELEQLQSKARDSDLSALTAGGVPATDVLAIAAHVGQARIAQARGDLRTAIREFEAAVEYEDKLAYMEPPYWYYPVRQSLGAALLVHGDLERAEEVLRASLARAPNNGWALFGLQQVYERRGDAQGAQAIERRLARAWAGPREHLDLARL